MAEEQKILLEQVKQLLSIQDTGHLHTLLSEQRNSHIAEIVEILDPEDCIVVFNCLEKSDAADVFEKIDEATRSELFEHLEDDELINLISELDPDEAADVLAELDKKESLEVLEQLDFEEAEQIKELMVYSEDSAGGIMDPVVLSVTEDATVNQAIQRIQGAEVDEDFYSVFVVDRNGRFLGDVRIRLLITHKGEHEIKDLIDIDTLFVNVNDDQEDIYNLFKKNELIVAPVLDNNHRLVGRITANRIIEVAEEEAAEDLYAMAGTDAAELETFSIINAARIRMTWLLPCLAGTAVTIFVNFLFRNWFTSIQQYYIFGTAILFSPMIAAISGNAGLQTSAIVICGLATGDLAALKMSQVFMREVKIALLVALCCGVVGGLICAAVPMCFNHLNNFTNAPAEQSGNVPAMITQKVASSEHLEIATAFSIAMFSAIMVSTTLGLSLPFLFRHIGLDPAISSGPLVTTANDSISVSIYLFLTLFLTN
ncbi:MAG: magnesium transporter [Planctomycetes bacterium]|nr:magnesium transporter [Planctomycetota bacterium]